MWMRSHSKFYPDVSAEQIWQTWGDVDNWPKWHEDLDDCKLKGDFKVGNYFLLKPKGMSTFKIFLTAINEGKSFTDCTHFFGAKMYDTHHIDIKDNGVILKNTLVVKGPLKWLWIMLVANNVADTIPAEMDSLVNYVTYKGKS